MTRTRAWSRVRSLSAVDTQAAALLGVISVAVLVLAASIGILLAAVWLGMHVIAPRLRRALDRAEIEDDHDGDRDA